MNTMAPLSPYQIFFQSLVSFVAVAKCATVAFFTGLFTSPQRFSIPRPFETLSERMRSIASKFNSTKCHAFNGFIVQLKSKKILQHFNQMSVSTNPSDSVHSIMLQISHQLAKTYNPTLIYTFNDEILMVFMYNEHGHSLFDRNINNILTHVTGTASYLGTYYEVLGKDQHNLLRNPEFQARFIQFKNDYDVLNYLVWRQHHCQANNLNSLYMFIENIKATTTLDAVLEFFENKNIDVPDWFQYGTFVKKALMKKHADSVSNVNQLTHGDFTKLDEGTDVYYRSKIVDFNKVIVNSSSADSFEALYDYLIEKPFVQDEL